MLEEVETLKKVLESIDKWMEPERLTSQVHDSCWGVLAPVYILLGVAAMASFLLFWLAVRGATKAMIAVDGARFPRWAKAGTRLLLAVRPPGYESCVPESESQTRL